MMARAQAVQAPSLPQVNLLPPEVEAARGLARTKRWLALAVAVALVLSAGMVGKAVLDKNDADTRLRQAQDETQRLNGQKAEYAEVPLVLGALKRAQDAQALGMSTEVLWQPYLKAIAWSAPPGIRVESLRTVSATPMVLPTTPTDPLSALGVSTVTFSGQSETVPDTETWLRNLAQIPGFASAWFTQATRTEQDGKVFYNVAAVVLLTDQVYAHRYLSAAEQAAADAAAAAGASTDGSESGSDD